LGRWSCQEGKLPEPRRLALDIPSAQTVGKREL